MRRQTQNNFVRVICDLSVDNLLQVRVRHDSLDDACRVNAKFLCRLSDVHVSQDFIIILQDSGMLPVLAHLSTA